METITKGSSKDLEKRLKGLESENKKCLVRAINNFELEQLEKDGPSRFKFNVNANYETMFGLLVEMYGNLSEINTAVLFIEPKDEFIEQNFRLSYALGDSKIYICDNEFYGEVEVYDISSSYFNKKIWAK